MLLNTNGFEVKMGRFGSRRICLRPAGVTMLKPITTVYIVRISKTGAPFYRDTVF